MATANDTTTQLNPGSGGDLLDESLVPDGQGGTAGKRPRVVLGGETSRSSIVEPVSDGNGGYAIPTQDRSVRRGLERIELLLMQILEELRRK